MTEDTRAPLAPVIAVARTASQVGANRPHLSAPDFGQTHLRIAVPEPALADSFRGWYP
jgi:hypothetical protein